MSLVRSYSKSIHAANVDEVEKLNISPAEDATRKQIQISWLQSTVTQEMFGSLQKECDELLKQAIILSLQFKNPVEDASQIVRLLIKINERKEIIRIYGRSD